MFEWISNFSEAIGEFIAEFTGFVSLVILIALFFIFDFKFLIRAVSMLRKLFKEQDLSFAIAFWCAWRIRKVDKEDKEARYKYLKAFCEFAIFRSKGEKLDAMEWKDISQKYFYEQFITDPLLIPLDSSFDILNEKVDHCIRKYFAFLNNNDKKYIHNKKKSKFVCRLGFENGFVYPASFINGLERKFADSWTDLLVKYNYTLKNAKYHNSKESASIIKSMNAYDNQHFIASQNNNAFHIRSNELFMMYSWLMWSPSYQMTFNDDKYKIILYGVGDESNTTNLILDTSENSQALWEQLKQCIAKDVFGMNLSIECELYELIPYVRNNIQNFGVETMPLINNLLNNSNDVHYILSYLAPTNDANLRNTTLIDNNDAFFSGYLWALFGRYDEQHTSFDIKNSVVFFEHSNLADSTSVDYFTKSMAQKTVLHFKDVLSTKEHSTYVLNACVAPSFEKKYIALINEELKNESPEFVKEFKKFVKLKNNSVTLNELLENIDEEFPLNEFDFKRVKSANEIGEFYATIYVKNFAPDERDSIDDLIYRTLELKSENHHDIILAYQNEKIVGGIVFDWFKRSNCGLIEYIVVDNKYRGMRIARKLVAKATAQMTSYAGKDPLKAVFIEIEDPEKLTGLDAQAAVDNYRRLQLWSSHKYERLDFNYIQPALAPGLSKLDNLMLAANTFESNDGYIEADVLEKFLIDFNVICNRIEDINDPDAGVKEMLDEIRSKPDGKVQVLKNSINYEKYYPTKVLKDEHRHLTKHDVQVLKNSLEKPKKSKKIKEK
ncbi:MAG: GNAT family N-acetyltransferase [Clostridia bacterium]|nr:GNAT family N-acetyltransferase [Clostridia bacterium]